MKKHVEQFHPKKSPKPSHITKKVFYHNNFINNPIRKQSNIKSIKHFSIKLKENIINQNKESIVIPQQSNHLYKHNTQLTTSIVLNHYYYTNHQAPFNPIKHYMFPKRRNKNKHINLTTNLPITPMSTGMRIKTAISKRKHEKEEMSLESIKHLGSLFRLSNYKQNIIIDDEGNNNLNADTNNPLANFIVNKYDCNKEKGLKPWRGCKKMSTQPNTFICNLQLLKETVCETDINSEENRRIVEYKKMFHFLNENIVKMKHLIEEENDEEIKEIVLEKDIDSKLINNDTHDKDKNDDSNQIVENDFKEMIKINNNNNWGSEFTTKTKAPFDEINESVLSFINSFSYNDDFIDFIHYDNNNCNNNNKSNKQLKISFDYSDIIIKNDDNSKKLNSTSINYTIDYNNNEDNSYENAEETEVDNNTHSKVIPCLCPHFFLHV